jgi:methanogenic corrinoid protein MtbC1
MAANKHAVSAGSRESVTGAAEQASGQDLEWDGLSRCISADIIPRLVLARRAMRETTRPDGVEPGPADVAEFAGLILTRDVSVARDFVQRVRERGASVEMLYLDLLAPAARRIGQLWEYDACDFAEVTVGLGRLQQVLHDVSQMFHAERQAAENGHRVLLVPVPGEQHSFGLTMVGEFFRNAGWDVWSEPRIAAGRDIIQLVRSEWFAVVGLSLASETRIDALARGIRSVRRASRNRSVGVLVGGPLFVAHPELVAHVGADATAIDGGQAPAQALSVLALLARRR